jgi:PleD family two-component response regulator
MEEITVIIGDGQPPAVWTLSIGVAEFSSGDSVEKLLSIANAAPYRAKRAAEIPWCGSKQVP